MDDIITTAPRAAYYNGNGACQRKRMAAARVSESASQQR